MQASLERLRRRREEQEDEGGFTLIELLIVIVILGILAAIVVFAVQNLGSAARRPPAARTTRQSRPRPRDTRHKSVSIRVLPSPASSPNTILPRQPRRGCLRPRRPAIRSS